MSQPSASSEVRRPSRRLVVFAKLPRAGEALGEEGAAELYGAFLEDTVEIARQVDDVARELWVVGHPDAMRELRGAYADFAVREQSSGDLGDRMCGAFDHAFGERTDHAVIVGSDLSLERGRG